MRRVVAGTCFFTMVVACADAPAPRPNRPIRISLMNSMGALSGRQFVEEADGPWVVRKFEAPKAPNGVADRTTELREGTRGIALGAPSPEIVMIETEESVDVDAEAVADSGRVPSAKSDPTVVAEMLSAKLVPGRAGARRRSKGAGAAAPQPLLKAGTTDDNAEYGAFLEFLAKQKKAGTLANCADIDVSDRRSVRVLDASGAPLPGATVRLVDPDRDEVLWRGTTYGDGRIPFYPSLVEDVPSTFLLEVERGEDVIRQHWNLADGEFDVKLPTAIEAGPIALDVVFLIDTTGSMSDEIERIKQSLLAMTEKLRNIDREFDLRYGAVLYRDIADQYVTKTHPFTPDIAAFDKALKGVVANGGGDTPESLNQGFAVAIDGMEWREGAAKVAFLIADAPPHMDYEGDVSYADSCRAAVARGIRVHSVAASGLDISGTTVFRQIAQFTRGKFIFIEYGGSVTKSAEAHGVTAKVKSNNLDDILFEQIRDEIAHWGRTPS